MKNYAALHNPDMFAGGYYTPKPTGMGDKTINSSIGSQWKKVIDDYDTHAKQGIKSGNPHAKMNVLLRICPKT